MLKLTQQVMKRAQKVIDFTSHLKKKKDEENQKAFWNTISLEQQSKEEMWEEARQNGDTRTFEEWDEDNRKFWNLYE